jgi:excinuclease ABC subunit C
MVSCSSKRSRPVGRLSAAVRALPNEPGVYRFRDRDDHVLYIGRAAQLRSRVASYWSDLGDRSHLAPMVAAVIRVEAVVCGSRHEAAWLERNLLEVALPPWNRTAGGQEVPVLIGLDHGPASPGLRVLHLPSPVVSGTQLFGPYLGGLQVRHAVSGLQRLHPLGYTGSRLSAAERGLAEQRGVTAQDRAALGEALTRILRLQPRAVDQARMALTELRHAAAASEAFELAARINVELEGLEWVTSIQRVTTFAAKEADITAVSDGLAITFTIRAGRLNGWDTRAADPHEVDALATPRKRWRPFAERNAALAAALAGPGDRSTAEK